MADRQKAVAFLGDKITEHDALINELTRTITEEERVLASLRQRLSDLIELRPALVEAKDALDAAILLALGRRSS